MRYLFSSYYNLDNPPRTWEQTYMRGRTMRNPGDLVYAAGLMDVLRTDENVEFIPTGYVSYNGRLPLTLDEINATCTALVMPFADHFRNDRTFLLDRYADLVRKVKIPVVVPCIGMESGDVSEEVNVAARRFVSAVLDKSSMIGLRGERTARYLEKLGFVPNRHFTVVGCPSMYQAGPNLPVMSWPGKPGSCALGMNRRASEAINRFLFDSAMRIPVRRHISQNDFEFVNYFVLRDWYGDATHKTPWYRDMVESTIRDGSYRFFFNLNSWKKCLRSVDCSISCRIHGSILAILCGVPAAIVPFESRTHELAEYHAIPSILPHEINSGDTIVRFADRFDFDAMKKRHHKNFVHFIDFLHKNGLKTAFDDGGAPRPSPNANVFAEDIPCETMKPLSNVSSAVRALRKTEWFALRLYKKLGFNHLPGYPIS